jgi:hypothetical protein
MTISATSGAAGPLSPAINMRPEIASSVAATCCLRVVERIFAITSSQASWLAHKKLTPP